MTKKMYTHDDDVQFDGESAPPYQDDPIPQHPDGGNVPEIKPDDIVIAIMGVTGVGKSTFISYFNQSALAGDSLMSCK